jgi:hypothetical protein
MHPDAVDKQRPMRGERPNAKRTSELLLTLFLGSAYANLLPLSWIQDTLTHRFQVEDSDVAQAL